MWLEEGDEGDEFCPYPGHEHGLGQGVGLGVGRGLRWGNHFHGGCRRSGFRLGQGGLLSTFGVGLCGLWGGRLSRRVNVRSKVSLLFGLLGNNTSLILLPMGHCCGITGIQ